MRTLVIYYSYSGNTTRLAKEVAAKEGADLIEAKEKVRQGKVGAYISGSIAAMGQKRRDIQPIKAELGSYDRFIVMGPVWAGNPAPAFNSILDLLPPNKQVDIRMVSGSGKCNAQNKVSAVLKSKGCTMKSFENIKA